jgi:hypothetical protein
MLDLIAWNKETNTAIEPERLPINLEWARFPNGTKKQYVEPVDVPALDIFTTNNEMVTVNGNPPAPFSTVYFGVKGDSVSMSFDIVDGDGVLQTQIDSVALGYPPVLALPVLKVVNGSDSQVVDEVYFSTNIIDGVISVNGSFPASGNWKMLTARINAALGEIGANWTLDKPDVTFRINS